MRFATLFLMTIAVWLSSAAQAWEAQASDKDIETWLRLSERCRVAIEQGERLDTQGLDDLGPSIRRVPPVTIEGLAEPARRGHEVRQHSWQQTGSSFVVVEEEYPGGRRSCVIRLAPDVPAVTAVEEADFVSAFLHKRQALIATGTHEERNPDPILSTNLGLGPIARSASGCRIISGLQIETRPGREPFFNSFSAEQAGCAPPR